MKDEEKTPSQVGLYDLPRGVSNAGDKVLKVFNTLKRKADRIEAASPPAEVTPLREIEPNIQELGHRAMDSFRLRDEVIKMDHGFMVV